MMKAFLKFFGSIRLTVTLLALSIVLIFFGTLDQVDYGIRHTQEKYFESFFAFWSYPPQWILGDLLGGLPLPMPGGYLIGPLLIINLLTAHFLHFQPNWKKSGIALIHTGVVLLLVGQLVTQLVQEDSYMWLNEGGSSNFLESFHDDELVITDRTEQHMDAVVSLPASLLKRSGKLRHPKLPFQIEVRSFFPNSSIVKRADSPQVQSTLVNRGIGLDMKLDAREIPVTYQPDERNITSAIIELVGLEESIGVWLVSNIFDDRFAAQTFTHAGRDYEIALRYKRDYLPFSLTLIDFTHDRYPGTDIPKNYSSKVRLINSRTGEDRQVLIYMNHPLRYEGLTFYQASFGKDDTASMFQVVRNPGFFIPYLACILTGLGLLVQFTISLTTFAAKRSK